MGQKQESMIHKLGVHEPVFTKSQLQLSSKLWSKPKPYPTVKKFGSVHFSFFFSVSISTTWLQTVTFWMETNLKKCQKKKRPLFPGCSCLAGPPCLPQIHQNTRGRLATYPKNCTRGLLIFPAAKKQLKKKKKSGNYQDMNTWKCSAGHRDRLAEMPLLVVTSAGGYVYQQHQQHIRNGQIFM